MKLSFKAGTTSKIINEIFIQDSSSTIGAGLGSLVYNTAGLTCKYKREGASSWTTVSLVTATAGTWTSGGFCQGTSADTGDYEFHPPDASIAAGAKSVAFSFVGATNMAPLKLEIELTATDNQDAVRMGMTALPNATAGAANGIGDTLRVLGTAVTAATAGVQDVNMKNVGNQTATAAAGVTFPASIASPTNITGGTMTLTGTATTLTNDPTGVTTLLARLTATRAGLLDNLDTALSSVLTAVNNLNNLSALANIFGSPLLEIPDSGSTLFPFTVRIRDEEGHLVDSDSLPTITAANAAGTDRSGNLSAVSHPGTGKYTFTYSVSSAAAEEGITITMAGAVGASARDAVAVAAVVNYDSITTLAAIKAKTDNLPASPATEGSASAAAASAATAATQATAANTVVANGTYGNAALLAAVNGLSPGSAIVQQIGIVTANAS